jgi:hypothetical protein
MTHGMTITGLADATAALRGAVLGPTELAAALGFDPLAVLTADERAAVGSVPFGPADLERARSTGEMLVLRLPRDPEGPLTMLRLAERLGGLDPRAHRGVGYSLRDEWIVDDQPFAAAEVCAAGWYLVRRAPDPATPNCTYRVQDEILARAPASRPGVPPRRSAVEAAYDLLCWHRHAGERLLADAWDWGRSLASDGGFVALGEFRPEGLGVIAYSRAVRFGTLGVCPQR